MLMQKTCIDTYMLIYICTFDMRFMFTVCMHALVCSGQCRLVPDCALSVLIGTYVHMYIIHICTCMHVHRISVVFTVQLEKGLSEINSAGTERARVGGMRRSMNDGQNPQLK